jgi:phosphatidylglycerophosphate synthase
MNPPQTAHPSAMQKISSSANSAKPFCRPRNFKNATRLQDSFTAATERKALLWLAARLSPSINSDHLTLLGFAAMFLAGCSYALARWTPWGLQLATLFLALNWFGDSLDGTLARVRNRQRPRYGFYVDHMIDSFGALFLMGGLAASGYIDWRIAMGLLVAFLLLSIESYLASYTLGVFCQIWSNRNSHSPRNRQRRFILPPSRANSRMVSSPSRYRRHNRHRGHDRNGHLRRGDPHAKPV